MTLGSTGRQDQPLPALRDLDQPFAFNMRLYNRPYRFEFYDTASPTNYTLLKPSVIILCYNIGDPDSLLRLEEKSCANVGEYQESARESSFLVRLRQAGARNLEGCILAHWALSCCEYV